MARFSNSRIPKPGLLETTPWPTDEVLQEGQLPKEWKQYMEKMQGYFMLLELDPLYKAGPEADEQTRSRTITLVAGACRLTHAVAIIGFMAGPVLPSLTALRWIRARMPVAITGLCAGSPICIDETPRQGPRSERRIAEDADGEHQGPLTQGYSATRLPISYAGRARANPIGRTKKLAIRQKRRKPRPESRHRGH